MAARVVLSDDAWAAVRAAYEGRDETVPEILVRFGIRKEQLYGRLTREKWQKRSDVTVRHATHIPPAQPFTSAPALPASLSMRLDAAADETQAAEQIPVSPPDAERPPETHAQRVERLHRIIDRLLVKLERTMANNPNMSPQDQEKTARAVTQTVTAMERVADLANTQGKVPETDGGQSHERAEADRMRREIAERLERLSAQFGDKPAKPE